MTNTFILCSGNTLVLSQRQIEYAWIARGDINSRHRSVIDNAHLIYLRFQTFNDFIKLLHIGIVEHHDSTYM